MSHEMGANSVVGDAAKSMATEPIQPSHTGPGERGAAIDIIIPTRNRGALIAEAIASVCQSSHVNFRLWIVDQSDDSATQAVVSAKMHTDSRVHYLRSTTRGANFARNEGVAQGTANLLAFVDDDCRVDERWLANLVAELQTPGVAAVFGRVLPDERSAPSTPTAEDQDQPQPVSRAIPMALKDGPTRRIYERNRFNLSFGHGANMGWQRAAFLQMGGFDGFIGAGGPLGTWDERDAGYRILARGGRIVYTPRAVVFHRHWRDWAEVRRAYRGYAVGTGAATVKYLRCGDWGGIYLLCEWFADQGFRQILSGLLKWQSWQKVQVGWLQLIYPWVGVARSLRYPVDQRHVLYRPKRQTVRHEHANAVREVQ